MTLLDRAELIGFVVVSGAILAWGIIGIVTNQVTGGGRWGEMPRRKGSA